MSDKKTHRFTRQRQMLDQLEKEAQSEIAKIVPEIGMLPPESIDSDLLNQIERMLSKAKAHLETAKNGG